MAPARGAPGRREGPEAQAAPRAWLTVALMAGVALLAVPAPAQISNLAPLVSRVAPAVAFVVSKDENGQAVESGTAFAAGADRRLLTALHVVDEAAQISVLLPGQQALDADVLGVDIPHDIALLDVPSMPRPGPPALALGDSDAVQPGEDIIVVGYPLSSPQNPTLTVTHGIISALQAQAGYVQIDAAANPGNSGGPVLALDGKVIGILDATVRGAQNFNFAVPINFARALVAGHTEPLSTPQALPLTAPDAVPILLTSPGVGPRARTEHLGARCVTPPPRAAVLDDVAVTMEAEGWLHVITWLSWGKGAPPDSPAAFARADGSHAQRFAGGMARLHLQPDDVCLNYVAWNDSILPLGLTFTVEYTLGFRVFRTSLP